MSWFYICYQTWNPFLPDPLVILVENPDEEMPPEELVDDEGGYCMLVEDWN